MEQVMKCDNCTWQGNYREANPAQRLHWRLALGDIYTDVECPECGALAYPVEPEQKPPQEQGKPDTYTALRNLLEEAEKAATEFEVLQSYFRGIGDTMRSVDCRERAERLRRYVAPA